jgi:hypothetical protein
MLLVYRLSAIKLEESITAIKEETAAYKLCMICSEQAAA